MPSRSSAKARYSVYVIELDARVWNHARFREANPEHDLTKPCVYVGMTGLPVERRFANHRRGHKSNPYVAKYGVRLLPNLYRRLNPMRYELARLTEVTLAQRLRERGYAVWQA
jgi:predicted GIY-YIG superfamily endonuclease